MDYKITGSDGHETLTVFLSNGVPRVIGDAHPSYQRVKSLLGAPCPDEDLVVEALDARTAVGKEFVRVSSRVSIDGDVLLFDNTPIDNALSRHMLRLFRSGESVVSAARFMERLAANPDPLVRVHLWKWLAHHDFTLTDDGHVIGYKAVDGSRNLSIHAGVEPVMVDDVVHTGRIPYPVGARVHMDRALVDSDRHEACSVGLHVGTWDHARVFGGQAREPRILTVQFDPRDVVSVPSHDTSKLRVCSLIATGVTVMQIVEPVVATWPDNRYDDGDGVYDDTYDDEDEDDMAFV